LIPCPNPCDTRIGGAIQGCRQFRPTSLDQRPALGQPGRDGLVLLRTSNTS
jgi:hypothetical protein